MQKKMESFINAHIVALREVQLSTAAKKDDMAY